jgi:hypothetical protein
MDNKALIFLFLSIILFLPSTASAGTGRVYACVNDSQVQSYINGGRVVVARQNYSSCSGNVRLMLEYPSSSETVCYPSVPSNIPNGFVVYQVSSNYSNCNAGSFTSGYKIKRPGTSERVCQLTFDIPTGYIITSTGINTSVCGVVKAMDIRVPNSSPGTNNWDCQIPIHAIPDGFVTTSYKSISACNTGVAQSIQVPRNDRTTTVCDGSPIPAGFAFFGAGNYSGCSTTGSSGPGYKIGPVTTTTATICANSISHIPAGYIATSISSVGNCAGSYRQMNIRKVTDNSHVGCSIGGQYIRPNGYVITQITKNVSSCNGGFSYKISKPADNLRICQVTSSLPAGWVVTSTGTSSSCDLSGSTASAVINRVTGNGPYFICANTTVPNGYVINGISRLWHCAGSTNNGWSIVRPNENRGTETNVCSQFLETNLPEGFVITRRQNFATCNGYSITKPLLSGNTQICYLSKIPIGYGVVSQGFYSQCGETGGSTIAPIQGEGPFAICSGTPIPSGYVVTNNTDEYRACGFDLGRTIRIPGDGPTGVCEGSPIPSGYIISSFDNNGNCGFDRGWIIELPGLLGRSFMCSQSSAPIPTGYTKLPGSDDYTSSCSHSVGSEGLGFFIGPINQQIVPVEFINIEADVLSKPADAVVTCSNSNIDSGVLAQASKNELGCN